MVKNITWITVNSQLSFNWCSDPLVHTSSSDCPMTRFNIDTSNCGSCPTTTNHTTVTCTDVPTDGATCFLSIFPIVCGEVFGNLTTVSLTLSSVSTAGLQNYKPLYHFKINVSSSENTATITQSIETYDDDNLKVTLTITGIILFLAMVGLVLIITSLLVKKALSSKLYVWQIICKISV